MLLLSVIIRYKKEYYETTRGKDGILEQYNMLLLSVIIRYKKEYYETTRGKDGILEW